MVAGKMGRPPSDNPKNTRASARLSEKEEHILTEYCKRHNKTRAEGIRDGILLLENK